MSNEIQNEEEFQAHLMKEHESKFGMYGNLYPKQKPAAQSASTFPPPYP